MFSAGAALRVEWLGTNDRKDGQCRDCTDPPVMKFTRDGVPKAYLCEKHGHETAQREGLPFPESKRSESSTLSRGSRGVSQAMPTHHTSSPTRTVPGFPDGESFR
jgi:hypothetical protein